MLAIQITWSLLLFPLVAFIGFVIGLGFRSAQVAKARNRVAELDKDLLNSHAELLELHREKSELEQRLKDSPIPVIPIKSKDESGNEKLPDVGMRKKLLGGNQPSAQQQ
jgi:hypothetical protein